MLGGSLCQILKNTAEVYAFHRDRKCYATCLTDFSLDLMDQSRLEKAFSRIKPDLVIHCAGLINIDKCEKTPGQAYDANVAVTKHIAQICAKDTKLVYISTDQVYGEVDDYSESNLDLQPVNIYGKTKLQGERKVQEHCTNYIIIRTNIFGWNIKPGRISSAEWIYNSLKNGQEITLFSDYIFTPIYVKCLGSIIMELVQVAFSGVVNVGSPEPCSKYAFGMQLSEVFGFDNSLIVQGSIIKHHFQALRSNNLALNTQKLVDLSIKVPAYKASINYFYENRPL